MFSCRHFEKGDFLVEYQGELLTKHEHENRQRIYHDSLKVFMFEFRFNGKLLWYLINVVLFLHFTNYFLPPSVTENGSSSSNSELYGNRDITHTGN